MKGSKYIKTKQILWAKRNKLSLSGSNGANGLHIYAGTVNQNLYEPLTAEHYKQFEKGDGGELIDTSLRPAKMKALHSSSAIGVNIFQYWDKIKKVDQIAYCSGLCNKANKTSEKIIFERKFKIDSAFSYDPNIDVVIENSSQSSFKIYAIECKFSEPYGSYLHSGIDNKYLKIKSLWGNIPNIYALAKSISPDDKHFKYLHPAQLIKHVLGLKKEYGKKAFRLLYLWYDVHGEESYIHRQEIERFTEIAQMDSVKFSSISYQKLISNLAHNFYDGNEKYINYIADRYL